MRYLFLAISVFIFAKSASIAQNTNITAFYEGPFNDVKVAAQRTNKPIFIDFTSKTCAHCIKMQKETFANSQIAQKLNSQFISYKVDMSEKTGQDIAKYYNVTEYPTFILLDATSKLKGSIKGFWTAPSFLKEIDKQMSASTQKIEQTKKKRRFFGLFG